MAKTSLTLTSGDGLAISLDIGARLHKALHVQLEARHRAFREESFRDALDRTVAAAIYDALDYDLKLPLPQQLEMAAEISRELHIPIPPDALEFAGAAATYIGRYLPRYRMSKATARKVLGAE